MTVAVSVTVTVTAPDPGCRGLPPHLSLDFSKLWFYTLFTPMNVVPHPATEPRAPKLLDRMRSAIRVRHYSIRTEEAYLGWVRRFFAFHRTHPRDLEADSRLCERAGVELIFAPDVSQMYPSRNITWVNVEGLTAGLCGRNRPGHFQGVTTVCNKLFNIVRPDVAFFGQKDAQQAIVIKRMVADTNLPLEIEICPTVREKDGLAMSSRNKYLDEQQRKDALLLYKALTRARQMVQQGVRNSRQIIAAMTEILQSAPDVATEYANIVDPETLAELETITDRAIIAVAAKVKTTRLIDNIIVDLNKQ